MIIFPLLSLIVLLAARSVRSKRFLAKYGYLYDRLKYKYKGKKVIFHPIYTTMRKLALTMTVVFLINRSYF